MKAEVALDLGVAAQLLLHHLAQRRRPRRRRGRCARRRPLRGAVRAVDLDPQRDAIGELDRPRRRAAARARRRARRPRRSGWCWLTCTRNSCCVLPDQLGVEARHALLLEHDLVRGMAPEPVSARDQREPLPLELVGCRAARTSSAGGGSARRISVVSVSTRAGARRRGAASDFGIASSPESEMPCARAHLEPGVADLDPVAGAGSRARSTARPFTSVGLAAPARCSISDLALAREDRRVLRRDARVAQADLARRAPAAARPVPDRGSRRRRR